MWNALVLEGVGAEDRAEVLELIDMGAAQVVEVPGLAGQCQQPLVERQK